MPLSIPRPIGHLLHPLGVMEARMCDAPPISKTHSIEYGRFALLIRPAL